MTVNCFNIKRGDGKTKRAIELCIHGVREGKNVLFLVRNMSEVARVIELFIKCEFIDYTKIDIYPYTGNYMERLYGKKYNLVVIDECFNMKLDEQARFLEEMSFRNPNCGIVGFGTEKYEEKHLEILLSILQMFGNLLKSQKKLLKRVDGMKIRIPEKNKVFFIIPSIAYDYRDDISGIWICWLSYGIYLDFTE